MATEGILLIDKEKGCTSFDVVAQVRRALKTKSVGHTGTLDPLATGLLVMLVGRYTRFCDYLTASDKTYQAKIELGKSTSTDDAEGEVLESADVSSITEEQVQMALVSLSGPQMQVPPLFSAISVGGERAYKKARRGESIELQARPVVIDSIHLDVFKNPYVEITVRCSKGTYIRSLARDLGKKLGVPAHLADLRRIQSGSYDVTEALQQSDLQKPELTLASLKTGIRSLRDLSKLEVDSSVAHRLRCGQRPQSEKKEGSIFLAHCGEELVAMVKVEQGRLIPLRGFHVDTLH